jgi:hypothetical protein
MTSPAFADSLNADEGKMTVASVVPVFIHHGAARVYVLCHPCIVAFAGKSLSRIVYGAQEYRGTAKGPGCLPLTALSLHAIVEESSKPLKRARRPVFVVSRLFRCGRRHTVQEAVCGRVG